MTRRNWRALVLAAALMPSATLRARQPSEATAGDGDLAGDTKFGRERLDAATDSLPPEDLAAG